MESVNGYHDGKSPDPWAKLKAGSGAPLSAASAASAKSTSTASESRSHLLRWGILLISIAMGTLAGWFAGRWAVRPGPNAGPTESNELSLAQRLGGGTWPISSHNLLEARQGFRTEVRTDNYMGIIAPMPPHSPGIRLVQYPTTNLGEAEPPQLPGYLLVPTAIAGIGDEPPQTTKPLPAVVWLHRQPHGITPETWGDALPLQQMGVVVFCPSYRGDNRNPGSKELFFGELEDVLSALRYVQRLPYIDPKRVTLLGVGEWGGTLALLAAVSGLERCPTPPRQILALDGLPELSPTTLQLLPRFRDQVFRNPRELELRSMLPFLPSLRVPTLAFFRDDGSIRKQQHDQLATQAKAFGVPLRVLGTPNVTIEDWLSERLPIIGKQLIGDQNVSASDG